MPTTLKKRNEDPAFPGVFINSVTLLSASNFVDPYGDIGDNGPLAYVMAGDLAIFGDLKLPASIGVKDQCPDNVISLISAEGGFLDDSFLGNPASGHFRFLVAADEG